MDKDDLKQLIFLNREIEKNQRELEELTTAATRATAQISMAPGSGKRRDKVADYAVEIVDMKMKIAENLKKCFMQRNKILEYIQEIPESEIRQILYLRYMKGMSWQNIAFTVGYQDESVPRKRHDRYLEKNIKNKK